MVRVIRRDARTAGIALLLVLVAAVAFFAARNSRSAPPSPLAQTAASPEALAGAVLDAMQARDRARLEALAMTEDEFRAWVWPELPVSAPEANFPFAFVWGQLHDRSLLYLDSLVAEVMARDYEGYEVAGVVFTGDVSEYDGVTVYRDTEVRVRNAEGDEETVRLFGSTIEQGGRYKVFSYVVD